VSRQKSDFDMYGQFKFTVLAVLVYACAANELLDENEQYEQQRHVRGHHGGESSDVCSYDNVGKYFSNCTGSASVKQFLENLEFALTGYNRSSHGRYYGHGYYDVEATVEVVAQVSIPTLCRDFTSELQCQVNAWSSIPSNCVPPYQRPKDWTSKELNFTNYLCVQQLSNLQAAQKCLTYDLVADVVFCGLKEHFATNCTEQDIYTCAQQKISNACGAVVAQAVTDTRTVFADTFLNGSLSNEPFNICRRSRHYGYMTEFFKFF